MIRLCLKLLPQLSRIPSLHSCPVLAPPQADAARRDEEQRGRTKGEGGPRRKASAWIKPDESLVVVMDFYFFAFEEDNIKRLSRELDPGSKEGNIRKKWQRGKKVFSGLKEEKVGRKSGGEGLGSEGEGGSFLLRCGELLHPSDLVEQLCDEVLRGGRRDKRHINTQKVQRFS